MIGTSEHLMIVICLITFFILILYGAIKIGYKVGEANEARRNGQMLSEPTKFAKIIKSIAMSLEE